MAGVDAFIALIRSEFPDDRLTYQRRIPTFHPQSADEASRFFRLANTHGQKVFITGFGNNIDPRDEPFISMVMVRTDRLNRLLEINPNDLYVTAGAGYPLREINKTIPDKHLWLPHAELPYAGSVGGGIAAGLRAQFRGHEFPLKRYLLKAVIVTPEGDIIEPGSICFKSVSGYDVVKVFFNSWGLLGLIISASFRVMPDSAKADYADMCMLPMDRDSVVEPLDETDTSSDAVYCRKIRSKFDPNGVLPIV